jgi:hypothetical protein
MDTINSRTSECVQVNLRITTNCNQGECARPVCSSHSCHLSIQADASIWVRVSFRLVPSRERRRRDFSCLEDAYAIALQRVNSADKASPISLAYFGIFDGHGGKEAAEFARQHLCQHILEQDEFWSHTEHDEQDDQSILSAIRKGFLACHNDMWNHVATWAKTSSGLPSTSGQSTRPERTNERTTSAASRLYGECRVRAWKEAVRRTRR